MKDCVFCKIVRDELPSAKIWEDKDSVAFLDICPNVLGQTLIIPKKHHPSFFLEAPEKEVIQLVKKARTVANILKKALKTQQVAVVIEGEGVAHLHIKLYPMHNYTKELGLEKHDNNPVYYEKYKGFISTQLGPRADISKLNDLAQKIRSFI